MNLPIVCYDRKLGSPPSVMLLLTNKRPNGEDCMSLFLQALAQEIDSCIKWTYRYDPKAFIHLGVLMFYLV